MSDRPTLRQQRDEVLCCLLSIQSAVEAWQKAPEKFRGVETGAARSKIEPLTAAVSTFDWLLENEDWIRVEAEKRKQLA